MKRIYEAEKENGKAYYLCDGDLDLLLRFNHDPQNKKAMQLEQELFMI